jgi:glucokinase
MVATRSVRSTRRHWSRPGDAIMLRPSGYRSAVTAHDEISGPILAIDIGGTKTESAIVDDGGAVHCRHRQLTGGGDADEFFGRVVAIAEATRHDHLLAGARAPVAIGVGCGGPMSPAGDTVSPLNIPQWREFPLRRRLAEHFELPTWVDNDAKALALGEGWLGAAADQHD